MKQIRIYRARVLTPALPPDITPYKLVSRKGIRITYLDDSGKERRTNALGQSEAWFDTVKECQQFITKYLTEQVKEKEWELNSRQRYLSEWLESLKG
jgi:hypothetical protein